MSDSYLATRPLRICLINGTYHPLIGGAERQMQHLAAQLTRRGHQVNIVTYRVQREWPKREMVDGVTVWRTGGLYLGGGLRRRWGLALLPAVWQLMRLGARYDVIHVQQTHELAFAAVLVGALLHKPVTTRIASTAEWNDLTYLATHDGIAGRIMCRAIRRRSSCFVVLGSVSLAELRAMAIPSERIAVIPNAINVARLPDPDVGLPFTKVPRRVLCVGRLNYLKGVDVLLRAWPSVLAAVPDARLVLIGGGDEQDALHAQTAQLGVSESVEFVGPREDVVPDLLAGEMLVLPSRIEGMPGALLEAMAVGLPCVATRVGNVPDVVIDAKTGLLVDPEDPDALAKAMIRVMTDVPLAVALGRSGQERARALYGLDRVVELYERLFARVAGRAIDEWREPVIATSIRTATLTPPHSEPQDSGTHKQRSASSAHSEDRANC